MPDTEMKEFKTIVVASAATGIGVMREDDNLKFSDLHKFYSHFLGYPIWTHEMGRGPIMSIATMEIFEAYPELPTKEFCENNAIEAAQIAIDIYGETISVPKGNLERPIDPVSTLEQMVDDKSKIIVVKPPTQ